MSCTTAVPVEQLKSTRVADVPEFAKQIRNDDCGAVALASLLGHAGYQVSAEVIDAQIYDPVIRGSLLMDMENYLTSIGVATKTGQGSLAMLRSRLQGGIPILIPIDLGWGLWRRPHYVVVFGFDKDHFLLHERHNKTVFLAASELEDRWRKSGYLYLYLDISDER